MARQWSFETARELIPDVRERTARAVEEAEELEAERALHPQDSDDRARVERRLEAVVGRWVGEMEALGLEVKGLWLVDFDTGSGYLCWKWPEQDLEYFHGYDEGFAGRARIH